MNIQSLIRQGRKTLAEHSPTAHLDTELLLAKALDVPRVRLWAWPESVPSQQKQDQFQAFLERRAKGEPVAYILGEQAFWSLTLMVNNHTLIPRPETELLVETALTLFSKREPKNIVDLGTGSGAIALALASERSEFILTATDQSPEALLCAKENAKHCHLEERITFLLGNWCEALEQGTQFDAIISNPPYIQKGDPHLIQGDVAFEPRSALCAEENGLQDLHTIIQQSKHYLKPGGWLLLEHGFDQGEAVRQAFKTTGYVSIQTIQDLAGLDRVTLGRAT